MMQREFGISESKAAAEVQEIYRPVLRGYFAAFALYYLVMLPTHIWSFEGFERISMVIAAGLAAGTGVFGMYFMRKSEPGDQVALLLTVMNLLVVGNIVIALNIGFDQAKLVYFVIIGIAFALASVSFNQSLLSLGTAAVALASFARKLDSEPFIVYAFLSIGAAIAALAISHLIRAAMRRIAVAKIQVENELDDARELGARLEAQSLSDSLTKLPNRRAFFAKLREAIAAVREAGPSSDRRADRWLVLLDLDGFKAVNDVHGHITGDLLLKEVAERLTAFADDDIFVSRMGGDEFNIIIRANEQAEAVRAHCERLLASLSAPYSIEDRNIRISASAGLKQIDRTFTIREQISQADFALMFAKRHGRNRVILFNEEIAEEAQLRSRIEHALRHGKLEEEIHLVYQPQLNLHSESIVRAEVLARWESPSLGAIEPDRFIMIAEESGLITNITLMVIDKAFQEMKDRPFKLPISINLSSHDIVSSPTIEAIIDLAKISEIDPKLVEFEVTETAMMPDTAKAVSNLELLQRSGFTIALDDFGTGYSNFSYLRSLPITKLKVDRSFLENPGDPMTEKILSSLAGMARALGVHCLLEGIEDEIGLLMARRAGAESVQGYLFGRPMRSAQLHDFVRSNAANDVQCVSGESTVIIVQ